MAIPIPTPMQKVFGFFQWVTDPIARLPVDRAEVIVAEEGVDNAGDFLRLVPVVRPDFVGVTG